MREKIESEEKFKLWLDDDEARRQRKIGFELRKEAELKRNATESKHNQIETERLQTIIKGVYVYDTQPNNDSFVQFNYLMSEDKKAKHKTESSVKYKIIGGFSKYINYWEHP
jgi:hypothetical protein